MSSKKDKFDFDFDHFEPKIFRGIDSIRIKKRSPKPAAKSKQKKHHHFSWYWLLLFLPALILFSFWGVQKTKAELNVYKFFANGKYLVLFQNNSEIRPTGGFIGSFAVVEFQNYRIKNINFNSNIYKLDSAYTADHVIPPPKPLAGIANNRWSLRDANFNVSFPEAAKDVEWFYEQESGDKVDGIITVNASLIRDIVKITGPIKLENSGTTITSDNFFTALTTQIENDYYQNTDNKIVNEPKSILAEMMPLVFKKTLAISKIKLSQLAINALKSKDIMFYSNNTDLQNEILKKNWGGNVNDTSGDYLYVNNANIGGGKSSLNVLEDINYKVTGSGGSYLGALTLTKTHIGSGTWPDQYNHNWTKVLVPEGSQLQSAQLNGKDVTAQIESGIEAGKSYFAIFIDTIPGTSSVLKLTYHLPKNVSKYQLLVQKQSGALGDTMQISLDNKILFNGILAEDKMINQ